MRARSVFSTILLGTFLCTSSMVEAQKKGKPPAPAPASPTPAPAPAKKISAREKAGRELMEKGDYDSAITEFLEGYEDTKEAGLLYLIAQAYDKKGSELANAKTYYEQYLAASGGNPPEAAQIQSRLSAIESELAAKSAESASKKGTLRLEIDRKGAVVEIEDKPIGTSPLEPLSFSEGSYTVRVVKEGFKEYLGVVDVTAGEENIVKINLDRETKPRWGLWTGIAIGVIAGGVGITSILLGNDGNDVNEINEGDLGIINF